MSYVVLARKWRPMSFEDLIGQSHVSRTLANAIQSGRVAHAFLFTGVRGVGKTTSARILAKALNCMGTPEAPTTGPTVTPCLQCAACREIAAGTDVDVREIDGASYNGVDEVRKLQDSLPYRPARDRFKIFIVDEVHMLSQSAWNAFLKTLEEPPPHVKFIFATTEVQKVPVTILSRVQRFDFKLIPTKLIAERLAHVLSAEGVESDDRALSVIAREAAGSMRDAMSLLDQVIAWNDQALDGDSVSRVLGVASRQVLHDMAAALVDGDGARCLAIVGQLANQGYDMATVARDVLAVLRDLVVSKVCSAPGDLLDLADEERADVTALAERTSVDDLVRLHQGFSASFDDVVRSGQVRAALEMLLVRLARRPPLIPIDDLVSRLAALEKRLTGNAPRGPSTPPGGRPGPRPDPRSGSPMSPRQQSREAGPRSAPANGPAPDAADEPPGARFAPASSQVPDDPVLEASAAPSAELSPPPEPRVPSPAERPSTAAPQPEAPPAPRPELAPSPSTAAPQPEAPPAPRPELAPSPSAASLGGDLETFRSVIGRVRAKRPELAACLHHAEVVQASRERLVLAFEAGTIFERNASAPDALALLRAAASEVFGGQPEIVLETRSVNGLRSTLSAAETHERNERKREALARAKQHPKIALASRILGAKLKEIRLPEE
ncbi:MAG TPA: DNA polymerase III subunit gamma/tau [Polyangiaceae bacterium]|nr:DNA polymerase III subunit gamma/tau [Polyangiaceae bacterium]